MAQNLSPCRLKREAVRALRLPKYNVRENRDDLTPISVKPFDAYATGNGKTPLRVQPVQPTYAGLNGLRIWRFPCLN